MTIEWGYLVISNVYVFFGLQKSSYHYLIMKHMILKKMGNLAGRKDDGILLPKDTETFEAEVSWQG